MLGLVRHQFGVHPLGVVLIGAFALFTSLVAVGVPWLVGSLVSDLPAAAAGGPVGRVALEFGVLVVVLALQVVIAGAQEPVFLDLSLRTEKDVLARLARLFVAPVGIAHLEDPAFLDRAQRVRSRVWEINQGMIQGGYTVTGVLTIAGATLSVWATVGRLSALALLAGAVAVAVVRALLMRRELDMWVGATEDQRHADYAFSLGTGLAPAETRVFGLSDWLAHRYWDRVALSWRPFWRKRIHSSLWALLLDLARAATSIAVVIHVVSSALDGALSIGAAVTAIPLVLVLSQAEIGGLPLLVRGAAVLADLVETERLWGAPLPESPRGPTQVASRDSGARTAADHARHGPAPAVELRNVSFTYPGRSEPVLSDLSLAITAGESVGLVGLNGAGKSTLIRLLTATLRPDRGVVLVDGVDLGTLADTDITAWQRRLAVLTQAFCRYPMSARDNVTLGAGRRWTAADEGDLELSAGQAGALDVVADLTSGWATVLDPAYPDGQDVSGGQWQRIALARAKFGVSQGAGMMVLDEPAAALDVRAEAFLVARHLSLTEGVTSLVVSHRFSVLRPIPRIVVLERGRITEDGSHEQLMQARATYARLFTLQSARLVDEGAR